MTRGGKKYELIGEDVIATSAPQTNAPTITSLAEAILIVNAYEKQQKKAVCFVGMYRY